MMDLKRIDGPGQLARAIEPPSGYRLVRRRGRGGFGEVWEAEGPGGIHVALKFVHLSPRARSVELRALGFLRDIHHPNVLANFGSWESGETLVVGMELADGSLWDRYVAASEQGLRGIPRSELLVYMAGAAEGLDYLNEFRHTVDGRGGVGLQHRDVKPPNLLLFGRGVKVADLGMARVLEGDRAGHTGIWTYSYAAPEFFRGVTARQSDQYGLAVTYCQVRSGRLPYEGGAAAVTAGHLFGEPDLEALPEAERALVGRALAKEPDDRWPDCRSLVEALRALDPVEAPERLARPEDPLDDIPRGLRSSTSFGGFPPEAPGAFTSSTRPGVDLAETGDPVREPAQPPPTPATAEAIDPPGPDLGPEAGPIRSIDPARPKGRRLARRAASVLAVGLALAASGVRPTTDRPPPPLRIPSPKAEPPAQAASPDPAPEPTPAPAPASVAASEPISAAPPAPVADEVEPDDAATTGPIPAESATATRSDLVPRRLARRFPLPDPTPLEPERPAAPVETPEPDPDPLLLALPVGPDPVGAARAATALGLEFLASNAPDRAIAEFDRAIRLRPGVASTYFHRALARHRASHYPEALADYSEAIRLRPDDPLAHIARGQAHHDLGAYGRALIDFDEAVRLRPEDPTARIRRGMARYRSDDFAGAVADFDETLRLDPKNLRAREFRDDALARLGGRVREGQGGPKTPARK